MRSARSSTTTSWPARVSCWAAASPAGPEPTTATRLPVFTVGMLGRDPALVPRPVDDLDLDLLDRDRVGVDAEHARRLARRRAQPAGELGEVVGGVQPVDGVAPVVAVDEVVPVGDQVAERAAVVAERDAAVHAAPGLGLDVPRPGRARRPPSSPAAAPAPAAASAAPAPTSGTRWPHPSQRPRSLETRSTRRVSLRLAPRGLGRTLDLTVQLAAGWGRTVTAALTGSDSSSSCHPHHP